MKTTSQSNLVGFALPSIALLPGFLIPVFERSSKRCIQQLAKDQTVDALLELSSAEQLLDIHTMNLMPSPKIVPIGSTDIKIGGEAVHSFYDLEMIYVGTQLHLTESFVALESQIIDRLQNCPFTLAGLYDFIGRPDKADMLRSTGNTSGLVSSTTPYPKKSLSGSVKLEVFASRKRRARAAQVSMVQEGEAFAALALGNRLPPHTYKIKRPSDAANPSNSTA